MISKLFRVFSVFRGSKSRPRRSPRLQSITRYRIRSLSSDFCPLIAALYLLPAVLCPPARAAGSWLVDGQSVQTLEVQTTNADPNALYTDGSRTMQAPLKFDASVSSPTNGLFRGWFAPDGAYVDLLILDEDEEVLWLSSSPNVMMRVGDMFISSSMIFSASSGNAIAFEDKIFEGGWKTDSVPDHNQAVINRTYADTRYIQRTEGITTNHTIQAGDVLQIQNGIITAINP